MAYGAPLVARRFDDSKSNRFLATLPAADRALIVPHLRTVTLDRGVTLHEPGGPIEHVDFVHDGMISLVAVTRAGASVETVTVGRWGVIGASAGLGSRAAVGRAIVQLPGEASRLPASQFLAAARQSKTIHDLVVRNNDLLMTQTQQSVACNALHPLEARLARWLLQTHDCMDGNSIPLTQEFLAQMLGVRRTTVTIAARLFQSAGMIHYRRGHIQVLDRAALEEIACECYFVIKQHIDETFPARSAAG